MQPLDPHVLALLWDALARHTSDFVGLMDEHGRALFMNRSVRGAPVSAVEGKLLEEFLPDERAASLRAMIAKVRETGGPVENDALRVVALDGSERWYVEKCLPVQHPEGPPCFLLIRTETTPLRRTKDELRASEQRYRTLFESNPDPVLVVSQLSSTIVAANAAAARLYGKTVAELCGSSWLSYFAAGHCEQVRARFQANPDTEYREVLTQLRADGSEFAAEIVDNPIEFEGQRARIAVVRDVSLRERFEAQLRHAQKMESIGLFVGGVTHDFNNLLTIISSCAEDGRQHSAPTTIAHEDFVGILEAARRGAALNRKLMLFSKQDPVHFEHWDLCAVVDSFSIILKRALTPSCSLKIEHSVPYLPLRADRTQLEQVLLNLVINAKQASEDSDTSVVVITTGRVQVNEQYRQLHPWASAQGSFVELCVRDHGVGIRPELLPRIFEPFFTTKEAGSGLGLSVVHGVLEQHGGQLGVESQPGQGTSIYVLLPIADTVPQERPLERAMVSQDRVGGRLLLAEDEPVLLSLARSSLEALGYEVVVARDGEEALLAFEDAADSFDLVVLDVVMPKLAGPEALRRMRALQPKLKALFVTGHAPETSQFSADLEQPGLDLMRKPFTQSELAVRVQKALKN